MVVLVILRWSTQSLIVEEQRRILIEVSVKQNCEGFAALASCCCMIPIIAIVIIIVDAASPISAILEVVFWILLDCGLSTINSKNLDSL
jgi:hypothetical protein